MSTFDITSPTLGTDLLASPALGLADFLLGSGSVDHAANVGQIGKNRAKLYQKMNGVQPFMTDADADWARGDAMFRQAQVASGQKLEADEHPDEAESRQLLENKANEYLAAPDADEAQKLWAGEYLANLTDRQTAAGIDAERQRAKVAKGSGLPAADYAKRVVELRAKGFQDEAIAQIMGAGEWDSKDVSKAFLDRMEDEIDILRAQGDFERAGNLRRAKLTMLRQGIAPEAERTGDKALDQVIRYHAETANGYEAFSIGASNALVSTVRAIQRYAGILPKEDRSRDLLEVMAANTMEARGDELLFGIVPTGAASAGEFVGGLLDPVFLTLDLITGGTSRGISQAGRTAFRNSLIERGVTKGIAETAAKKATTMQVAEMSLSNWFRKAGLSTAAADTAGKLAANSLNGAIAGAASGTIQRAGAPGDDATALELLAAAGEGAKFGAAGGAVLGGAFELPQLLRSLHGDIPPGVRSQIKQATRVLKDLDLPPDRVAAYSADVKNAVRALNTAARSKRAKLTPEEVAQTLDGIGMPMDLFDQVAKLPETIGATLADTQRMLEVQDAALAAGAKPAEVEPPAPPPGVSQQDADEVLMLRDRVRKVIGIAKAEKNAARTDPLTQLANRRGMAESAAAEFKRADKTGEPLGVVSFDLSNFKALNDVFGHDAGDEALRIISKAIQEELRLKPDPSRGRPPSGLDTVGVASRPGGDEFAAILRKVGDKPAAMAAIARIEARVQKDLDAAGLGRIKTKGGTRFVSIVGGVELRKAKDVRSLEDLLSAADQHSIARKGDIKQSRAEPSGRFDISETEGVAQEGPRVKPGEKAAPGPAEQTAPKEAQGRIAELRAALMKASPSKLEQIREKALKGSPESVKVFEEVFRDVVRERGLGDLVGGIEPAAAAVDPSKMSPDQRLKMRAELLGMDQADPAVAKLREALTEPAPATASIDEVAGYIARHTEDAGKVGLSLEQLKAEVEADTAFQRGNIEYLDHREDPMVRVDVPIDELDYTGEPNAGDVATYAKSRPEFAPPIVAGPVRPGDAALKPGATMLVVDGKHRTGAARQRGEKTISAYVPEWYAKERGWTGKADAPAPTTPEQAYGIRWVTEAIAGGRVLPYEIRPDGTYWVGPINRTLEIRPTAAEKKAAKAASQADALASTPEERMAAKSQMDEALRPAVDRALAADQPQIPPPPKVAEPEAAKTPPTDQRKEPWQMTKGEFEAQAKEIKGIAETVSKAIEEAHLDQPNWEPLRTFLPPRWRDGMMFMGSWPGISNEPGANYGKQIKLHQYKHGITRKTISLDDEGKPWLATGQFSEPGARGTPWYRRATDEEALSHIFKELDEGKFGTANRETAYNERYIAERTAALEKAGFKTLTAGPQGIEVSGEATTHRREVEKALAAGKTVPPEVLADYPDLQPKKEPANVPDAPSEPAPAPEADQPAAPAPERPAGGPEAGGEPEKPYPGIPVRTPAPGFVPAGRPISELMVGQKFTREGSREPLTVTRAEDGESVVHYRFPNGRPGQISILAQGEVTGMPPDIDAAGFVGPDVEIGTLEVGTKFGARGGQWEITEHVQGKRSKDDMVRAKNLKDGGLELFDSDHTTEAPTPEERRATAKRDREAADAATEASRAAAVARGDLELAVDDGTTRAWLVPESAASTMSPRAAALFRKERAAALKALTSDTKAPAPKLVKGKKPYQPGKNPPKRWTPQKPHASDKAIREALEDYTGHRGAFAQDVVMIGLDGRRAIATNGKQLHVVLRKTKGTFGPDGNFLAGDPDPEAKPAPVGDYLELADNAPHFGQIDTIETMRNLRSAALVTDDNQPFVMVLQNPDGSLGFAAGNIGTHVEINVKVGHKPIGTANAELLMSTLEFMHRSGDAPEKLALRMAKDGSVFIFEHEGRNGSERGMLAGVRVPQGEPPATLMERPDWAGPAPKAPKPDEPAPAPDGEMDGDLEDGGEPPGGGADFSPERPANIVDTQDFEAEHAPAGGLFDSSTDATVTAPPLSAGRVQKIVKARAAAVRAGKAYTGDDSPHALIRDLVAQLEIASVGDRANYRSLKPGGGALGFYQAFSEGIRLRYQDDVPTAVHEIGHALHKIIFPQTASQKNPMRGLSPKVFPKAWQKDLVKLGKRLYGSRKPNSGYASEGWAEAIRMLVVEPDVLKSLAPTLYESVVRKLVREQPGIWWSLRDAGGRWKGLKVAGAENPIRQMIRRTPPAPSSMIDRFDDMRTLLYDRLQRVVRMKKDMGINPAAHLDPEIQMRRAQGIARGQFDNVMEFGIFDPADPNTIIGPSLESVVKPLHRAGKLELWEDWMVAKRTIEKRAQGIETMGTIPTSELVDFVQRVEGANPEFRKAATDFQQINEWLVQTYAVGHGLIDSDVAQKIVKANLHYITFRHARTDTAAPKRRQFGKGYVNQKAGLGRFRGGQGEQIFPPLETFMMNMKGVMQRAQLNRAGKLLVRTFWNQEGMARWIDQVARPMDAFELKGADLSERVLKQLGVDINLGALPQWLDDADKASGGQLISALAMLNDELVFTPGFRVDRATRQFTVLDEGKPKFYEVKDDRLFDVLEGLHNMPTMSALARFLHLPAMVLKMGATQLNPEFFIPNFIRDTVQALVMTERDFKSLPRDAGARLRGARAALLQGEIADLLGVVGVKRGAMDNETLRLARESGAFFTGEFDEYHNAKTGRVDFDAMFAPKSIIRKFWAKPWSGVKDLLKLGPIARINNQIEMATRLGEFRAVLEAKRRRGLGDREAIAAAGQAASDVTLDWSRGGTLSRDVNYVSAFFNASMLGTDKLARFIKQNPTKAATAIFSWIIAPSIATHLLNRNDEEYWQLPYQERDRHWHIPTGLDENGKQHWVKIPKPYGVGLFGTAMERALARLDGIDPVTGKKGGDAAALQGLHRSFVEELTPLTLTKDNIPLINIVGLQPLLEVAANHSFHFDEPIVRPWEAGLPFDEQGADRASRLAVALGQAMNYSPRKIDYLVRGFTGGLGRTVTQAVIDPLIGAVAPDTRVAPNDPIGPEDWLVVRRFIEGEAKTDAEVVTRFFEQWEQVERRHRGLGARKASGQDTSAYADAHQAEIALYEAMQPYRAEIADRFAELRRLYRDKQLPADQLEAQIRDQIEQIQLQARRGLTQTAQEPTK